MDILFQVIIVFTLLLRLVPISQNSVSEVHLLEHSRRRQTQTTRSDQEDGGVSSIIAVTKNGNLSGHLLPGVEANIPFKNLSGEGAVWTIEAVSKLVDAEKALHAAK